MNKNHKSQMYILNVLIFMTIIFVVTTANMLYPKTKTTSETENRELASMPEFTVKSMLSGTYFRDFENYFADNFIFREELVKVSVAVNKLKGLKLKDNVTLVEHNAANIGGETDEASENKTSGENSATSTKGNLLILNDTVMEIFKFSEKNCSNYADMINTVQQRVGDDVKVYSLLAPIQIEFLEKEKYKNLSDSQFDAINFINGKLNSKITTVDAYTPIKENADKYIYFRSDHHWTALGAYYAYTGFAKSANLSTVELDKYESDTAPGFLGHLSTIQPSDTVNKTPDDVIYYKPFVKSDMTVHFYDKATGAKKTYTGKVINETYRDTDQKYGIFLGGDFALGVIKTDVDTDRKMLVIKDSYANAFIPFLLPHYSEIYVIDPRHYKENIIDLIKENDIKEMMFLNYILTTNFQTFMDSVLNLTN